VEQKHERRRDEEAVRVKSTNYTVGSKGKKKNPSGGGARRKDRIGVQKY